MIENLLKADFLQNLRFLAFNCNYKMKLILNSFNRDCEQYFISNDVEN